VRDGQSYVVLTVFDPPLKKNMTEECKELVRRFLDLRRQVE